MHCRNKEREGREDGGEGGVSEREVERERESGEV